MWVNDNRETQNRIVILRAERGWSQKVLAELLGVNRQTILSLDKNRYNLSLKLSFAIALLFEIDLLEVFQYKITKNKFINIAIFISAYINFFVTKI